MLAMIMIIKIYIIRYITSSLWSSYQYTHQWRLLRGVRLITMVVTARMEWHQTMLQLAHSSPHLSHVNENVFLYVFYTIPPIPLQPLAQAPPPQLRCHQPPVITHHHWGPTNSNHLFCMVGYSGPSVGHANHSWL
jgi:hypothetical protein